MENERIIGLQQLLANQPENNFARYGMAMEYSKTSRFEDAVREFMGVIERDPSYAYAYFHGGRALESLGRIGDARRLYENGIAICRESGNQKAYQELQGALDLLPN